MRFIETKDLQPGMVLAQNIIDSQNRTLITKGYTINGSVINKLKEKNILSICIDDELSKGIVLEETVPDQLINKIVNNLENLDLYEIMENAKELRECMQKSAEFVYNPLKLRNQDNKQYHAVFVTQIMLMLAMSIKTKTGDAIPDSNLDRIAQIGLLHNIGYLAKDPNIFKSIKKEGDQEYDENQVARYSFDLLYGLNTAASEIKKAVRLQDVRADNRDIPGGYSVVDCGIYAKMLKIAKDYEKLITTVSPDDKELVSPNNAILYLKTMGNDVYVQDLVKHLFKHVPLYSKGTTVRLENGQIGVVTTTKVEYANTYTTIRLEDGREVTVSSIDAINEFASLDNEQVIKKV